MTTDVLGYLASKNLQLRRAPGAEVHTPCLFCDEDPGKRGRLYINIDPDAEIPGLYECKLCGAHGALPTIKRHFGDASEQEERSDDGYQRRAVLAEAATYYHQALSNEVIHWLKTARGLTLETIVAHQLGFADGGLFRHLREMEFRIADILNTGLVHEDRNTNKLSDFLHGHVTIPYFSSGNVVMIRGRDLSGGDRKYVTPKGQKTRLYNADVTWENDEIVVCEGEFDAMVLGQVGIAAVAVPGASTWQDSWDAYFTETRRMYVVFDNDEAGTRGAEKVAKRFSRARVVAMPEHDVGQPKVDISEFIIGQGHTVADFKALLANAGGGLLITVEEAMREFAELQGMSGLKFGIKTLDLMLEPGLLKSQVMVVLAKSGVGKGHPLDTEVPTPVGLRRWGDLRVGDEVFGASGQATKVTDIYDRGVLPTYRVTFSDRTTVLVDGEHLWNVKERYGKRRDWVDKTMTTTDVLSAGLRRGSEYRFIIPIAEPVDYPSQPLPIEPYTLGAVLANGYLGGTTAVLTTPDFEVAARVGQHYNVNQITRDACPAFIIRKLIGAVKRLGLNVKSAEKFIPEEYQVASVDQRCALLQGLMDGDGTSRAESGRRNVLYSTTSPRLADDLVRLVTSLGGTAMVRWYERGEKARPEGVVSIMLPPQIEPFATSRKRRDVEVKNHSEPRRAIVAIDQVEDHEIRCIKVDAPDSLYLIGRHHVVTHNTLFLINLFQRIVYAQPEAKILFISLEQTRGDWWDRARRIYRFFNVGSSDEDAYRFWRDRIRLVDRNRVTAEQLLTCINDFTDDMGVRPDLVAVDYLGYFAQSFPGDRYSRTADAIMTLKAIAKDERLAIITPHQVNRMTMYGSEPSVDAARDSGVVEETADFVIPLWSPDTQQGRQLNERTGEFFLKIGKSRHGGVGHTEAFQFAPLSLALVPRAEQKFATFAANELTYQGMYRNRWPDALMRHEAGTSKDEADFKRVEQALWKKRQLVLPTAGPRER